MKIKKTKYRKKTYEKIRPFIYQLPALITIFALQLVPIAMTFYYAFTNFNLNHLHNYKLVGFKNFQSIINGPFKQIFLPVFEWTFAFAAVSTLGCFIVGLILAMLLNNPDMKESFIYKGLLVLPWAIPGTIATLTWQGLLNETNGGINLVLKQLHIISSSIPWFTNPGWARTGIIIANIWLGFPYMMNICIGALSQIPDNYYEAADIDGANRWQKFSKITLPSITNTSLPLLISTFAYNFNNFGAAWLIMEGLPARPGSQYAGYTDILITSTYRLSMTYNLYNIGSALSIMIFIVIGTLTFINLRLSGAVREVD